MNNKKEKIIKIIILVIAFLLVCTLCFFASESANENSSSSTSSQSDSGDITSLAQEEANNIKDSEMKEFTSITVDNFLDMYNGTLNKIVLISRPTCHYCQIAEPILKNISYKYDLEINNLNTDEFSDDDFSKLESSNERFEDFGTPLLVIVSNGTIVDEISGLTTTEIYTEFFRKYEFINE